MADSTVPFTTLLFLSGALSGIVAVVVLSRFRLYSRRIRLPFAAVMVSSAVWATAYGFELGSAGLAAKLLWTRVAWAGQIPLVTLWFVFVLAYARSERLDRRMLALLAVEPGLALALALTGPAQGWFVSEYTPRLVYDYVVLAPAYGPLYDVHLLYSVVVGLVSVLVLLRLFTGSQGVYRGQTAALLLVVHVPLGCQVIDLFRLSPVPGFDVTPILFNVTSGVSLVAFYRYRLFDLTPVAQDTVVDEMRDGVVVLDEYRRVVEVNPAARRLGVADGPVIGDAATAVVPRHETVLSLLDDAGPDRVEITVPDDGQRRYYEATATPLSGPKRRRGHLLVFRDVTERRRTEAQFRALIENTQDVVSIVDPDGTRRYTSPSAERILGYAQSQLTGRSVFDLVHPADREAVRTEFRSVAETGDPGRAEYRMRHADGSWRTFESVCVDVRDDATIEGMIVNSRDVTDRHRYEQRLRVLNRVLRHDLRNDMNVVLGNADLLLESNLSAESRRYARTIKRKAASLVELGERARQIDYTLHGSGDGQRPVDVVQPIERTLDAVEEEHPGAVVRRRYPDEQWVSAGSLVDTAISNVLENAVEHNDRAVPEVEVTVEAAAVGGRETVEVRVADNGPGIPASERRAIARGTETKLAHVSGLGLWLTKWIVDQSNGDVRFADNDPRGAIVEIRLPAASPDDAPGSDGPAAGAESS